MRLSFSVRPAPSLSAILSHHRAVVFEVTLTKAFLSVVAMDCMSSVVVVDGGELLLCSIQGRLFLQQALPMLCKFFHHSFVLFSFVVHILLGHSNFRGPGQDE